MERFPEKFASNVAVLPAGNIDTDQIIPARFLKATDKVGLGGNLFADWRYLEDGSPDPKFVLNRPEYRTAQILLAGDNFGSGSSREHAPWALVGFGFKAVISTSFADIFRGNALKNRLLPVVVTRGFHAFLNEQYLNSPRKQLEIDLTRQKVVASGGRSEEFHIDPFSKTCLLTGVDELGYLLNLQDRIALFERAN